MPDVTGTNTSSPKNDDQGQASNFADPDHKLDTNVKLNLENLIKIDEKLQSLIDLLKMNKTSNIS